MITEKVLHSVIPVDLQLTQSGRYVTPVNESILHQLVKASISPATAIMGATPESPIAENQLVLDSKRKSADGSVEHDDEMSEAVELVAEAVRASLDVARNSVVPTTKEVFELYTQRMNEMAVDASRPATIVPNVYHDLWAAPQLEGMVDRFANVPLNEYKPRASMPMITGVELEAMIRTGIDTLDEAIDDWYRNLAPERPLELYREMFVMRQHSVGRATNVLHQTETGLDRNDILLTFLIANGFENHMPDGVAVSLDEVRNIMANVREQAGRAVASEIQRRERDVRNKILVFSVRERDWEFSKKGRLVIMVNNDVYLKYLEEGGTVESIYGAALLGARMDYDSLLTEAERYTKQWQKFIALHNQRVSAQVYQTQREAARVAMAQYVNRIPEDDLHEPKEHLMGYVVSSLGLCQPKDFEDEMVAIRNLVCDVLYHHTNAKMVLNAMDVAEQENPDMPPRECALYATIDLLARWMASQIELKYE